MTQTATYPKEISSTYWDKEMILDEIEVGKDLIRVSHALKGDQEYMCIRKWYPTKEGEYAPSNQGINIRIDDDDVLVRLSACISTLLGTDDYDEDSELAAVLESEYPRG